MDIKKIDNFLWRVKERNMMVRYMRNCLICVLFLSLLSLGISGFLEHECSAETTTHYPFAQYYIGGSGEGNYSSIQAALDNASENSSIYIYKGIYKENIHINKKTFIYGEDKERTIIDGNNTGNVITITTDDVQLSNLTVRNCGTNANDSIIYINSSNTTIDHVIIQKNHIGIYFLHSQNNTIIHNSVSYTNTDGIGILLENTTNSTIKNNVISKQKKDGIQLRFFSKNNIIVNNTIKDNERYGVYSYSNSTQNEIYHNTFRQKGISHAYDECQNTWDYGYPIGGNIWDDYEGTDMFYGPDQQLNGSDMIGDHTYRISPGNLTNDTYPIMDRTPSIIIDDDFLDIIAGWNTIRFRSIQTAITNVEPYAMLNIMGGMYYERLIIDKPLTIKGIENENVIINGDGKDSVVFINASQVHVKGLQIINSGNTTHDAGIFINGNSSIIEDNTINDNNIGILVHSSKNHIENNHIRQNKNKGIHISKGTDNQLFDNWIYYNDLQGIFIKGSLSSKTLIDFNHIHNNNGNGICLLNTSNQIIMKNNITSNNGNGILLSNQSYFNIFYKNNITSNLNNGISLEQVDNNTNTNTIDHNRIDLQIENGIFLFQSKNCTIKHNEIIENKIGIKTMDAKNNKIYLNNITSNQLFGLQLEDSTGNRIFNNNIKNKQGSMTTNAYDDGQNFWNGSYCIGGNHWDESSGNDAFHGPNQQRTGKDGIYDANYSFLYNTDHYPYVSPNGWEHRLIIESVTCGTCGMFPNRDFIQGLFINIINYGQQKTKTDFSIMVNGYHFNKSLGTMVKTFVEHHTLTIGSEDQIFISILTDGDIWKTKYLHMGFAEITINLDIFQWKGCAFVFRSFFLLLREEYQ